MRIVLDDERANKGEDFVVYQVYDLQRQGWVEVSKEVADEIAERGRSVACGFMPSGFHLVLAIPRRGLGLMASMLLSGLMGYPNAQSWLMWACV